MQKSLNTSKLSFYLGDFLNQQGQAYSTFKLLIAAIVAMAILAILIPIIMNVIGLIKASPQDEAKSLLSDLVGAPGALKHTKEVVFESDSVLAASALAERLPLAKDQICMSTGEFEEDDEAGFECLGCDSDTTHRIVYHGNSDRVARIAVVCNVNLTELEDDIDAYGLEDFDDGENDIASNCQICENKGKCCAIILKRS